jgi:hypothetical protein
MIDYESTLLGRTEVAEGTMAFYGANDYLCCLFFQ